MSQEIRNQLPKEIFFSYREGSNGYSCLDYGYEGDVKYIREDVTAELLESEREKSEKLAECLERALVDLQKNIIPLMDSLALHPPTLMEKDIEKSLTEYKTTSK